MKRKLTKEQQSAVDKFKCAQQKYHDAEDHMLEAFNGYWDFLDVNDFKGAKEYLRPMPDSTVKVCAFRNILDREQAFRSKVK